MFTIRRLSSFAFFLLASMPVALPQVTLAQQSPATAGSSSTEHIANISSIFSWTNRDDPSGKLTYGYAINSQGDIAGLYSPDGGASLGFLGVGSSYTTLNCPGSEGGDAQGLNDADEVVGDCSPSELLVYGYLYSSGTYTEIQYPGASYSAATGINNLDQIVGTYYAGTGEYGYLYEGGGFTGINYPGAQETYPEGINDQGQIVGSVRNYPVFFGFLYSGGNYMQIAVPGSTSTSVNGINNYGEIVGQYADSKGNDHGFIFWRGVFTRVDQPETLYQSISGINDSGSVVGYNGSETITLVGTLNPNPGVLTTPAKITFPSQLIRTVSSTQELVVTNSGAQALEIQDVSVSGPFVLHNSCPSMLPPAASCNLGVAFKPDGLNLQTGTITITDNATNSPQTVSLKGRGTRAELTPTLLNFGGVGLGQTSPPQTVTITNVGVAPLTISGVAIGGPDPEDFNQENVCEEIPPQGSCSISATFTPTTRGSRFGTLEVSDNGGASPQTVQLAGSGK